MNLTEEQKSIIDYAKSGLSFKVFAYAGSGKTSTMIEVCKQTVQRQSKSNRHTKGLFLAFNRDIAIDAKKKLEKNFISTDARTWHSLAILNIKNQYKNKLNELKYAENILRKHLYDNFYLTDQKLAIKDIYKSRDPNKTPTFQFRTVSSKTCKGYIIKALNCFFSSADNDLRIDHFTTVCPNWADVDFFLETFVKDNLFSATQRLLENIFNTELNEFPLTFAAALKIYQLSKPNFFMNYDFVIIDEAQDTDLVALDILNNQNLSNLQLIVVGDSYQQIYSWRGALDALNNVRIDNTLYLSKSFRFGKDIAKFATSILKKYFLDFQIPIQGNPLKNSKIYELQSCSYSQYNAIITRTNAGAFNAFIKAIEQNPKLLIKVDLEIDKLDKYADAFEKLEKGQKISNDSVLILFETIEQLDDFVEENPTDSDISAPYRLIKKMGLNEFKEKLKIIKNATNDKKTTHYDLRIATAHKSKGLEFNHVVIAEDFNSFLFRRTNPDNPESALIYAPINEEEVRLFYVAVTRAIESVTLENFSLIFVESLVKNTLSTLDFSVENPKKMMELANDTKLCHSILLKNLNNEDARKLTQLLENKDIFEITSEYLNTLTIK